MLEVFYHYVKFGVARTLHAVEFCLFVCLCVCVCVPVCLSVTLLNGKVGPNDFAYRRSQNLQLVLILLNRGIFVVVYTRSSLVLRC